MTYGARVALAALLLVRPVAPAAQEVTGPALKAAFIYHFVKFTTWPADALPGSAPLVMCVLGDPAVGAALEQAVKNRQVDGHPIHVSQMSPTAALRACQVLYVSGLSAARLAEVVASVSSTPVLTVSDSDMFLQSGGIAQFHYQNGQLRFGLAGKAASHARLQISSRLLVLSKRP